MSTYSLGSNNFNASSIDIFNYLDSDNISTFLVHCGLPVYFATSAPLTILRSDLTPFVIPDVVNPAVDNVYIPTDVWNIDIVGTWEQISRDISGLQTQTEKIAAFVGDIPLTLTSAQAYAPTISDAGNYVFPDMTNIWKYPQYFFDTLKGWGMFVGNCLKSVTVGDGGLSWIFYGGFVLLVCGGIVGKILMG